jgi:hypothetical protein
LDLNQSDFIRKFFAVVLLGCFALSNTPTKYLHWLFANHKDFVSHIKDSNRQQLSASGIDCHCETNVVIAPYTLQEQVIVVTPDPVCYRNTETILPSTEVHNHFTFGLRGPPAIS